MDLYVNESQEILNEPVSIYIGDNHFEDTLTPDEEYYNPALEPRYRKRNFSKINSEQWEMVSSELFTERRARGKL